MQAKVDNGPRDALPVTLDILGDWWDCYLYAGRLYLVTLDGDVWTIDWPKLVYSLATRLEDRLSLELSFIDARFLYGPDWERLVRDPDVKALIIAKINALANESLEVDQTDLKQATISITRRAVPEAISDLEIHRSVFYSASDDGLNTVSRHNLERGSDRQWDGEVVRLRASVGLLAIAAGTDGLRQVRLERRYRAQLAEPAEVLRGDFTGCSWLHSSIYGSSHVNAGALAVFSQTRRAAGNAAGQAVRTFEAALAEPTLFDKGRRTRLDELASAGRKPDPNGGIVGGDPDAAEAVDPSLEAVAFESRYAVPPTISEGGVGFSWAGLGLICRAAGDGLSLVRYRAGTDLLSKRISDAGTVPLGKRGAVADGDVAPFGVVVETDDELSVITADGVHPVEVRPVRWRTYQRATNYPNQLHVIGEDRLRIVSFLNEDMRKVARSRGRLMGQTRAVREGA